MHTPTNRHIVDQLADVRAEMKALKVREDQLKDAISKAMGADDVLGGDEFICMQSITNRKGSIDEKAMKAAGIDVDKFRKEGSTPTTFRLERRVMDEVA